MTQLDIFPSSEKSASDVLRKLANTKLRPTILADCISEANGSDYLPIFDTYQSCKGRLVKDEVHMPLY